MTQFDSPDQSKNSNKTQESNICAKALRLDFEQNQERSGLSLSSINVIAKSSDATVDANRQLEPKRQLTSTNSDTRYALGVDFVITALLKVAGITKVRQEINKEIDKKLSKKKLARHNPKSRKHRRFTIR